jgi:hypothetical protein
MNYTLAKRILDIKGILTHDRDILYGWNRVRIHGPKETNIHFLTKSLLALLLMKKGKGVITEAETRNARCVDVLQVTKNGLVAYEIENEHNTKNDVPGVDIVEIPLSKAPASFKKGIKDMERWLKQYMV